MSKRRLCRLLRDLEVNAPFGALFGAAFTALPHSIDAPMIGYGIGGLAGTDRTIGQVESGFLRSVPKAGGGLESQNPWFDRNDGSDMRFPFGPGNRRPGTERRNDAGFMTVMLLLSTVCTLERGLALLQAASTLRQGSAG
jgi:hypothetical protein